MNKTINKPKTLIIDLGSQYSCVLERRLRALYCETTRFSFESAKIPADKYSFKNYQVVVLSGSPASVSEVVSAPGFKWLINQISEEKTTPILGICFGMQLIQYIFGGKVEKASPLFGEGEIYKDRDHLFFLNIPNRFRVWGSFNESVTKLGHGFYSLASREKKCMISVHVSRPICTIQFHPELYETEFGDQLLRNFFSVIAKIKLHSSTDIDFMCSTDEIYSNLEAQYKERLYNSKVLVALSGGVDSSVLIHFLKEIMPEQDIYPVFISTSLFPKEYETWLIRYFRDKFSRFQFINWKDSIFEDLKGITSPEEKRKIIANKFRETFDELFADSQTEGITYFAQGTVFSDSVESGRFSKESEVIKTHHNIEMLKNKDSNFPYTVIEPLSELFKDQVNQLGAKLNLPSFLLAQQPFPGPGLAIRVVGEVTKEKIELLSQIHQFVELEFRQRRLEQYSNQYFPILLSEKAVGIKGDKRIYGNVIVLRAVETIDFMSAKVSQVPVNDLISIANKLISTFPFINRVLFDLTTKPAGTIEWE